MLSAFGGDYGTQSVTLIHNDSGSFEDRWVYLTINGDSPYVFTKGIDRLYLPVRHGEGKFVLGSDETLLRLHRNHHVVAQYSHEGDREATMDYPANPNGSARGIAGICDETVRIFGPMPHPDVYLHYTNHPRWCREMFPEEGMGLAMFRNAIDFARSLK